VCVSFFENMEFYFCIVFDSLLGIPNYFNYDSFTLGFRLCLTTLSFCSMCVLRFLYYLMCGGFFVMCVCFVCIECGCFCKV
jgi:hypothetical protein